MTDQVGQEPADPISVAHVSAVAAAIAPTSA